MPGVTPYRGSNMTSTRSVGPSPSGEPSVRTSIRVLRTPRSIKNARTAKARENDSRRVALGEAPLALSAMAFNCMRWSDRAIWSARLPRVAVASALNALLPSANMICMALPSGSGAVAFGSAACRAGGAAFAAGSCAGNALGTATAFGTGIALGAGAALGTGGGGGGTGLAA